MTHTEKCSCGAPYACEKCKLPVPVSICRHCLDKAERANKNEEG